MELFHEKNGHSKKLQKNKRKLSPIYFFKKNNVIKLPTEDQKIINIRGESGRLIEYFIKYKKKSLVRKLKTNFNHKDILRDFNYFTNSNFQKLYEKLGFSSSPENEKKKIENKKIGCVVNDEAELSENDEEENNKIKSYEFNNFDETHLEYYEIRYLVRGKYFVYPDSIPMIYTNYNETNKKMPEGLVKYLEKYQELIEKGRKWHYNS